MEKLFVLPTLKLHIVIFVTFKEKWYNKNGTKLARNVTIDDIIFDTFKEKWYNEINR